MLANRRRLVLILALVPALCAPTARASTPMSSGPTAPADRWTVYLIHRWPAVDQMAGITAGPDDQMWATAESHKGRIVRISPEGKQQRFKFHNGWDTERITTGPDGNLWFTDLYGNHVGRITSTGKITLFATKGSWDITTGPDGALWFTVGSQRQIGRITTAGEVQYFDVPAQPADIARGPDGNLWFTTVGDIGYGVIGRITPTGQVTTFPLPSGSYDHRTMGMTAGPDGNMWFTELYGGSVGRITMAGDITLFVTPSGEAMWDIASGGGYLWFAEEGKVGRLSTDGAILEFGAPFHDIRAIAVGPYDRVWITGGYPKVVGYFYLFG